MNARAGSHSLAPVRGNHIERAHAGRWPHEPDRVADVALPPGPVLARSGRDREGEIVHRRGITPVDGLYVLGLKFQDRRSSHLIGGVGADAAFIARNVLAPAGGARHAPTS